MVMLLCGVRCMTGWRRGGWRVHAVALVGSVRRGPWLRRMHAVFSMLSR